jgi:branched-chain amino acid transport system substrate-binding protein
LPLVLLRRGPSAPRLKNKPEETPTVPPFHFHHLPVRPALLGLAALAGVAAVPAAQAAEPIKIGVIGEESAVAGASITKAAQMAADDINAAGGADGRKVEIITYDDHSSAADGVRAFQRAVTQDKVAAVIGSYISEVALAIEPWSARLHMPFITPGAASNDISKHVHDDYEHYKYTFHASRPRRRGNRRWNC